MMHSTVRRLYREFIFLAREHPDGLDYARGRLKAAFRESAQLADPEAVRQRVLYGRWMLREYEAAFRVHRYRALARRS